MKRILIVEDSDMNAMLMKIVLRQICEESGLLEADYAIDHTKEENEAIQLIGQNDYCLIILDGDLLDGGLGKNVLHSIDKKFFPKIIAASENENFFKYCRESGIHALNKKDLSEARDLIIKLIKAGL